MLLRTALLAALSLVALTPAAMAAPWDVPFADDTSAILQAAQAVERADVTRARLLLSESRYELDDEGRQTRITRVVVHILDREGLEGWGGVGATWSPWHQDKAVVRGRVIQPGGGVVELDPSTLIERRLGGEGDIYWDRMALEGPLPGLEIGAVLETEVSVTEHRPFFEAGTVTRHVVLGSVVALTHRVVLSHPRSLKLKLHTWLLDDPPTKQTDGGVLTRTWEVSPAPSLDDFDPYLASDEAQYPMLGWSTGKSWADVARTYSDEVDALLVDEGDLETLAREAAGDAASDRAAAADRLLVWVQEQVRYTGLELGENALVPVAPAETLERGFGDCKDQSTLLVGLLRALGYDAHVALLRATGRMDSSEELPGLGVFDHAIVVMPGAEPIWMDPTNRFQRAGRVAPLIEGRSALIAAPSSRGLVKISATDAADNGWTEVRSLKILDEGNAELVEVTNWTGWAEASIRDGYTGTTDAVRGDFLGQYVGDQYYGAAMTSWSVTDPDDRSVPFSIRLTSDDSAMAWAEDDEAYAKMPYGSLLRELDEFFFPPEKPPLEARTADVSFVGPHRAELRYEITPPPGYELTDPPEDVDDTAGPVRLQSTTTPQDDGSVHVSFVLTLSGRRMTAEQLQDTRQMLGAVMEKDVPYLHFVHRAQALVDEGDFVGALAAARDPSMVAADRAGLAQTREAYILLEAGVGEAAWLAARAGTETSPHVARTWRALAWSLQHDELGRRFGAGWDRQGAIDAYRKALEVDPQDWVARADLSIVLEYDRFGFRYGDGADLEGAVEELNKLRVDFTLPTFEDNLLIDLFRLGEFEEFSRLADSLGTEGTRSLQVAGAVLDDGPARALATARRFSSTEEAYMALLEAAYSDLFATGHFSASADLMEAIAEGQALPEDMTDLLHTLREGDEFELPTKAKKPGDAAMLLLSAAMDPRTTRESLSEVLAEATLARLTEEDVDEMRQAVQGGLLELADELAIGLHSLRRLSLGALEAEVTSVDPKTALVLLTMPDWDPTVRLHLVVVKEGGQWRVLGTDGAWGAAGEEIARRAKKDPIEAATMLDFIRSDMRFDRSAFTFFRVSALAGESPALAELSAWMLACMNPEPLCLAESERLLPSVDDGPMVRLITYNLGAWYSQIEEFDGAERMLRQLAVEDPSLAGPMLVRTLIRSGKAGEVDAVMEAALSDATADGGTDEEALALTFDLIQQELSGDLEAALQTMGRMDEREGSEENANNRAWYRLILGKDDAETLRLAQVAGGEGSSYGLHTLATVYAEMDRGAAAREALGKAMAADDRIRPEAQDWYVVGRIAEAFGATEAAVAAYRRVERPPAMDFDSTWELSSRRLRALGHDPDATSP